MKPNFCCSVKTNVEFNNSAVRVRAKYDKNTLVKINGHFDIQIN